MAATNADVVGGMLENVRKKLQPLFEMTTGVGAFIKRASEEHRISTWQQSLSSGQTQQAFRVPLQRYEGGDYGTFSYDEGDLGGGTSTLLNFMSFGYFPDVLGVEISSLAAESTATSEQAVLNVVKYQLKMAIKTMQVYYDTGIHQDGTGVIATANGTGATPSGTNPTYILEPNFGPQRLRYNQPVDIYDSTLATKRNAATVRVASFDYGAKTVSLTGTVTTPSTTDRLAFRGMAATLAVGSWRNGLYTFNNSATSGFTGGLDRAVVTELVPSSVNASSSGTAQALVPAMPLLLNDLRTQRRDEDVLSGTKGISHMSQRAAWYLQGQVISNWFRGAQDKMIDLVPGPTKGSTTFDMADITYMISKKQDRSRVELFVPNTWCRVLLHDLKYHETPDGRKFFELRSTTTGNPKAGFQFYMVGAENIVCVDPASGGFIGGLAIVSGL